MFKKRIICLSTALVFLFTAIIGRAAYLIFSGEYAVSEGYNSYSLSIETLYPTLFYSNGEKITNNAKNYVALLKPNERTLADLHNLFPSGRISGITNELKRGYPLAISVDESRIKDAKYIEIYEVAASDYIAKQLISPQSSGLMSHIDKCAQRKIRFHIDAFGRMLSGDKGEIYEEKLSSITGLKTSLNKEIESIAYNAAENIKSGCIIIMDVKTSSILACITKPDTSYVNKPFEQYCVGSVFKLIVACCAIENNIDFYYNCRGKTKVGDSVFSCQKNNVHGFEDLMAGLANSCNCYFVNLALELGSEKLLETANKLGFSDEISLYHDWQIKAANLPSESDLKSLGELALFGFGQGKLTSSPLQICYSLCTIANGGRKNSVRLVLSEYKENENETEYSESEQVISEKTSRKMLELMRNVVVNGTGKSAESSNKKSAGKTATAQTGQFVFGKEMLNTWFAGVYPYDAPKYAIVVMTENGKSGSEDCAPIYREIVEKLNNL